MTLTEIEKTELLLAKSLLEHPGLAARIANFVGTPIEKGLDALPDTWNKKIGNLTQAALMKASDLAIFTMNDRPGEGSSTMWHKLSAAVCGGVGGSLGLAGLTVELPVSTTIILRSIADIARSEGESVGSLETKMACLEVFALGGKSESDDSAESGYYAVRYALAESVSEAIKSITQKGLTKESGPVLIKFITKVAERFGIQVTQKAAAQAIPAIGAAGGAIINTMFIDHFQNMARGHFIIRRLERIHSPAKVKEYYDLLEKADS